MQLKLIVEPQEAPASIINGLMEPALLQLHAQVRQYGQTQASTVSPAWDLIV